MQTNIKLLLFSLFFIFSCKKDTDAIDYEYHAHIASPANSEKKVGEVLNIKVDFESHAGLPVHHINVIVYNKATKEELYNMPSEAHVHASSGAYTHEGTTTLSKTGTYVLEANVWGEDDGAGEVIEAVEFFVK